MPGGGDSPAAVGVVDELLKVDGGGAGGDGDSVAFDAAVAESSVAAADEPGNGSFDQ